MARKKKNNRAGRIADGRTPYVAEKNLRYPKYMPSTTKGVSEPMVGLWHMRRTLLWLLGYASIDGKRCDKWMTYTPDKIVYFHKLIDMATERLDALENRFRRTSVLSSVFEQTQQALEFKHCLSRIGENEMNKTKLSYQEMMGWASKIRDFDGGINWLKLPQGIHGVRIVPEGADNDPFYFRHFTQHECGSDSNFRSWLCWDYIMDNKQLREHLAEKDKLTEVDAKKAKKFGDPVCTTLEAIKRYVSDMDMITKSLRTREKVIMNVFYVFQGYPDKNDKTPKSGLYVWERSPAFNKQIIQALGADAAMEQLDDEDYAELLSVDSGKLISVLVEGEGIGKNRRKYTINLKGKRGPIVFNPEGLNPYHKGVERQELPEDFQVYKLLEIEASKVLTYQDTINMLKGIPVIKKIIDQIGYEIPGDEPSDNPLDDNYDASKIVGKPIATKKVNEDSPIRLAEKKKQIQEAWEDEEQIEKDKKIVKKAKPVVEDDDIPWDDNDNPGDSFTKVVPPSDEGLEVITKKKRKLF